MDSSFDLLGAVLIDCIMRSGKVAVLPSPCGPLPLCRQLERWIIETMIER